MTKMNCGETKVVASGPSLVRFVWCVVSKPRRDLERGNRPVFMHAYWFYTSRPASYLYVVDHDRVDEVSETRVLLIQPKQGTCAPQPSTGLGRGSGDRCRRQSLHRLPRLLQGLGRGLSGLRNGR